MSGPPKPAVGTIGWLDLTVPDAEVLKDFYQAVAGWAPQPLSMGDYSDYVMTTATGAGVAGVCHARGQNENIPPVWLIYIVVEDLDAALDRCAAAGGFVLQHPRSAGEGRYAIIRDPAGVVSALYQG